MTEQAPDPSGGSPQKKRSWRRVMAWMVGLLLSLGLLAALLAAGFVWYVASGAPSLDQLQGRQLGTSSQLLARDGRRLGFIPAPEVRRPLLSKQIPQRLKQATVAIEDRRFYQHKGVDFTGVMRAAYRNLRSGSNREGGSTLTQQLVRTLYISKERTYERKIREAKLAQELDRRRSKEWILTTYLNNVPYTTVEGQTALGAQAGARMLFAKPLRELKLHQMALLAGLPQAPTSYNPFQHPERAKQRRDQVLDAMVQAKYISAQQAATAKALPLGVKANNFFEQHRASAFFNYVRQQLVELYGEEVVKRGGLKVTTTLDLKRQAAATKAITRHLNRRDDPAAALVSLDSRNGEILAMASVYGNHRSREFNLAAQAQRQPGSTFKSFVLAAAVDRGADPRRTFYRSKRLEENHPRYGPIKVKTYDNSYVGKTNLEAATLRSDNSVYMQLDLDLGPKRVKQMAYRLGIRSPLSGIPAEGLGGLKRGVTPLEMTAAYSTFSAQGKQRNPVALREVRFVDGRVRRFEAKPPKQALSAGEAWAVTQVLRRNMTQGTGQSAQIGCEAAGKTGTTDNHRDAWFAGYTPRMTTTVWVGYPNGKLMSSVHGITVSGSTFPAAIWGQYMRSARLGCSRFARPAVPAKLKPFCAKRTVTSKRKCYPKKYRELARKRRQAKAERARLAREKQQQQRLEQEEQAKQSEDPAGQGPALETVIEQGPARMSRSQQADFVVSASDGAAEFECQLDQEGWKPCESSVSYQQLRPGSHSFAVRAVLGPQRDETPAQYSWQVKPRERKDVKSKEATGEEIPQEESLAEEAPADGSDTESPPPQEPSSPPAQQDPDPAPTQSGSG